MMYSAFMFWLRCLVLLGLCSISQVFAGATFTTAGNGGTAASSAFASCQLMSNQRNTPPNSSEVWSVQSVSPTVCTLQITYTTTTQQPGIYPLPIEGSCSTSPTDILHTIHHNGLQPPDFRWTDWNPQANQCQQDSCISNFDSSATRNRVIVQSGQPPLYTGTDPSRQEFVCNSIPAGTNASYCTGVWNPTGSTCVPDCPSGYSKINGVCVAHPTCTSPQILNQQFICETPACPTGQVRETSLGACKPIVCTSPLIKVGNVCEMPKCPTGETYEYTNGVGQCVKNDPLCSLPMINVNGICKLPTCPTGMVLDNTTGSCKLNPLTNNITGGTGTGTGTGTSGGTTGTSGGGGAATGITGSGGGATAGGTTAGAGTGTSGGSGSGGTSTNTSKSGTCTTAPCGECDPTKETCGNTFGGSCKSGFKCNGDAIQCAVAQATNKAECLLKSLYVETEDNLIYNEGKATVDAGTKALGTTGGIQVASGGAITIDSTNPFSSSCPSDMNLFTYKGSQYMLPLAQYCNIFQIMGNIMLLCASLIALKIIMKVD